jgi:hypothetical protein
MKLLLVISGCLKRRRYEAFSLGQDGFPENDLQISTDGLPNDMIMDMCMDKQNRLGWYHGGSCHCEVDTGTKELKCSP